MVNFFPPKTKENVPILIVREIIVFPDTIIGLSFGRQKSIDTIKNTPIGSEMVIVAQRDANVTLPESKDVYTVGTAGTLQQSLETDQEYRILFHATKRVIIQHFDQEEPYYKVSYEEITDDKELNAQGTALRNNLLDLINQLVDVDKDLPLEEVIKAFSSPEPNQLINNIVPFLDARSDEKQDVLETININERLEKTIKLVNQALKINELEVKVAAQTQEELTKAQKEIFLREEMKTIQKELGENSDNENVQLKKKIESAKMPPHVYEIATKELGKLEKMPSFSPEISYIRNYLDWLIDLPWSQYTDSHIDIDQAKQTLDDEHYGLEKIKERILEYLAVRKLAGKSKGAILCFVGPPGTGKTSIGQSIAKALGRKFTRVSLGGIHDEAEIRGHRRTYVGAMPGRIIQGIKNAGSNNPVFMLDEIDKIGTDFRGDPSAALLEALDPEQNANFSDHYLEVPFDLSDVLFITTANILDPIPAPLRDRMEIVEFSSYLSDEKIEIARRFIIPKIVRSHGLKTSQFKLTDSAIALVVEKYTQEAGVRNLERNLSSLGRKIALLYARNDQIPEIIDKKIIGNFLGTPKIEKWVAETESQCGLVAALAVTEAGGEVLSVETTLLPGGNGNLILTGHLGNVMKESAQTALSYARSICDQYDIKPQIFKENDIHIHVPSGAIPKDGPSAGVAIALSLISTITQKPFDKTIGVTGEITLRGRMLRIGGLKEKVLAAQRAGLNKIVLPESNKVDVDEIPCDTQEKLDFLFAKSVDEILSHLFK